MVGLRSSPARREHRASQRLVLRYGGALAEANAYRGDSRNLPYEVAAVARATAYATMLADGELVGGAWTAALSSLERRLADLLPQGGPAEVPVHASD